jgi:D-3-phosphoglycerate dehydrogenase
MNIVLLEGLGVSDEVLAPHIHRLEAMGHTFAAYPKDPDPLVQVQRCRDAHAILLANMPLSPSVVETASSLQFIDVAFTGVDHIPMTQAKEKGIVVSNASGYATQAVAELCISLMIDLLRHVRPVEDRCRQGGTKDGLVGHLLCGKTVGLIGAGAIGRRVAALAKAFGCTVIAYNRSTVSDSCIDRQLPLSDVLKQADILSLHCPLTEATRGLIEAEELKIMKHSAILINTARGAVVDSAALAHALAVGDIAGAACDVFETEPPLRPDHPLLHSPNTLVTPHIAFATAESMEQRAALVFDNLYAWLNGHPQNVI